MKRTKKIGYIILTILEILLILGAYVVKYFTRKKMGMTRFVVYMSQVWEKEYPLDIWKTVGITVLIISTAIVTIIWLRKWQEIELRAHLISGVMLIFSVFAIYFIMANYREILRPYYFMAPMIGAGALLQIIKAFLALMICKKK